MVTEATNMEIRNAGLDKMRHGRPGPHGGVCPPRLGIGDAGEPVTLHENFENIFPKKFTADKAIKSLLM